MNDSILDDQQITIETIGMQLLNAHQYWLKKRVLFNILIGLAGFISVILFLPTLAMFDFLGIFIWGIVANALYSFGYICESYIITKTKRAHEIKKARNALFWSGTILYVIVSFAVPYLSVYFASV